MQIDLKASIRMLSMVILFSLIVVFVMFGDEAKSAVQFLYDSALTLFQVTIMVAIALTTVYLTQAIRETTWFDIRGAAREMGIIRNRVENGTSTGSDSIAVAIQYASNTLLTAVIILALTLLHM